MTQKIVNVSEIEEVLNKYAGTSGWAEATAGEIRAILDKSQSVSGDAVAEVRCRNGEIFGHIGSRIIRDMLPLGSKLYTQPPNTVSLEQYNKLLDKFEEVDIKAQSGLCYYDLNTVREFHKDIRRVYAQAIAEAERSAK